MSEKVVVSRAQAVAIFEGLGVKSAGAWKKEKMEEKVSQINLLVPDDTRIGDEALDLVLDNMIGAREMGESIEVISDKAYEERFPATGEEKAPEEAPEEAPEAEKAPEKAEKEAPEAEKAPEEPKEEKAPKAKKKPRGDKKYDRGFKVRGSESYHAGVVLKSTNSAENEDVIDDNCWEEFYKVHGSKGKNTRKGFMGAARQAVRAYLGHKSKRENPSKPFLAGSILKKNPSISAEDLAAEFDGETKENPIIAKKAIQAVIGYGLIELKD